MKDNLEIGSRIRNIRESMKLSRNTFSEKINISKVFLSQVGRGEKSISLKTLINICNKTGFSSDYILFGNKNNSSTSNRIIKILDQLLPEANNIVYNVTTSLREIYEKQNEQ